MANWHLCHMWSADARRTLDSHQRCWNIPWREVRHRLLCLFDLFPNCNEWLDSFLDRLFKNNQKKLERLLINFYLAYLAAIYSLVELSKIERWRAVHGDQANDNWLPVRQRTFQRHMLPALMCWLCSIYCHVFDSENWPPTELKLLGEYSWLCLKDLPYQ